MNHEMMRWRALEGEEALTRLSLASPVPVTTPGREEVVGACVRRPCQRGGTCRELTNGGYSCQCPPRTTGLQCEKELPPPYETPSFSGSSYLEVKKIKAYNKVQVRPFTRGPSEKEWPNMYDTSLTI